MKQQWHMDFLDIEGVNSDGYGMVPKKVMRDRRLSIEARLLYAYLCSFTGNGVYTLPNRKIICRELGIGSDTLNRMLVELQKNGYIRIKEKYTVREIVIGGVC